MCIIIKGVLCNFVWWKIKGGRVGLICTIIMELINIREHLVDMPLISKNGASNFWVDLLKFF